VKNVELLLQAIMNYGTNTGGQNPGFIAVSTPFYDQLRRELHAKRGFDIPRYIDCVTEGVRFCGIPVVETNFVTDFQLLDVVILR